MTDRIVIFHFRLSSGRTGIVRREGDRVSYAIDRAKTSKSTLAAAACEDAADRFFIPLMRRCVEAVSYLLGEI